MELNKILLLSLYLFLIQLELSFCAKHTKEEWKSRSIYQLVTDRFAKEDDSTTKCNDLSKYCGGTFNGIKKNLDYIAGMGFNAIWISPPLKNKEGSYHGYHNIDINSINENFGTERDLKNLIKECHKKDIWVILDAVPNHMAGDVNISTFIPFNKDEYYHEDCGEIDNPNQEQKENCRIWGMPDLKQENTYVKTTLINWLKGMIKNYDFDGVRYADVANVPKWFWGNFTKAANTYTLGIISSNNATYISDYQHYMDGVGDYPLYYAIRESFCGSMEQLSYYHKNIHQKYINPTFNGIWLGNHDNVRFLNECKNKNSLRNAIIFTLFYEGIPIFYYGDEQYFDGGRDPQNREIMFGRHDTSSDAYQMIKIANKIRKSEKIYDEDLIEVYNDENLYAFRRGKVLIIVTNSVEEIEKNLIKHKFEEGKKLCNKLFNENDCITVADGELKIKMKGEPKLYVIENSSDNNLKKNVIYNYLYLFLLLIIAF